MRAAIFIDGGYLLKQVQDARLIPDYRNLAAYLLKPLRRNVQLDLMRCYFYYCAPWMSDKPTEGELRRMAAHERFVAELQEQCDRWQVRLGKLERRREGDKEVFAQKRVDVQLSVDMVQHAAAGHIQHAVLVAGDSDFIPAVIATKQSGATLTLWCDRDKSVHRDLMVHADEVHFFDWRHFPGRRSAPSEQVERDDSGEKPMSPEAILPTPSNAISQVQTPSQAEVIEQTDSAAAESKLGLAQPTGSRPRRRRGRRRGPGKGAPAQASGDDLAVISGSPEEGHADAAPIVVTPAKSAIEKPLPTVPSDQPPVQQSVEPEMSQGSSEDTGEDGAADIKSTHNGRRRRGGRGRRRKPPQNTPPVAE